MEKPPSEGEGLGDGDGLGEGEGLGDGDGLGEGEGLGDGDGLGEGEGLGVGDGLGSTIATSLQVPPEQLAWHTPIKPKVISVVLHLNGAAEATKENETITNINTQTKDKTIRVKLNLELIAITNLLYSGLG